MTLDHESRANRFLSSMAAVSGLLANTLPGFEMSTEALSQLIDLLSDEAKVVVTPFRAGANDDED